MKKNLTVRYQKVIGNPVSPPGIFCGEAVFERESILARTQRGKLFVLLSITGPKNFDAVLSSKMILDCLEEEYFREAEGSPLNALERSAILASHRFIDLTLGGAAPVSGSTEFNLILAVSWGQVLYLGRVGSGVVYLLRGGLVKEISLGEESQVSTASGLISEGDVLILGTRDFGKIFPPEKILNVLPILEEEISRVEARNSLCAFVLKFDLEEVPSSDEVIRFPLEKVSLGSFPASLFKFLASLSSFLGSSAASFLKFWRRGGSRELFLRRRPEVSRNRGKSLLTVSLVVLSLLFLGSVFLTLRSQRARQMSSESARLLDEARSSVLTAADLVDLNNSRARELLERALQSLDRVERFSSDSEVVTELRGRARTLLSTVTKEKLARPRLVYDFAFQNKNSDLSSLSHAPAAAEGGRLFVSDRASGNIFTITLKGDQVTVEKIDQGKIGNPYSLTFYDETLFGIEKMGVFSISLKGLEVKTSLIPAADLGRVAGLHSYLGNLYFLQSGPSAIFKSSALTGGGYSKPLPWLKEERDLSSAISFSVDGSIYILGSNGRIFKFETGKMTEFTLTGFDDAFSSTSAVYTDYLSSFLYVLDAKARRLTVLSKDGVYQGRYLLENIEGVWENPVFVIDEGSKKGYFLLGSKLFQVALE